MEALYLLIPLSIVLVFVAIWAFFRMSDSGQFDDPVGPALRVLQDDDAGRPAPATSPGADMRVAPARHDPDGNAGSNGI